MVYTVVNFKTKKEMLEAIHRGDQVRVYQPGMCGQPYGACCC